MRSLPTELTAELDKEIAWIRHLITITISASEIYRWTDCDQDIVYGGNWFTTKGIVFSPAESSYTADVDSISFTIGNIDKGISNLILTQSIVGKECRIERIALDKNIQILGAPAILFLGYLDTVKADRKQATIEVYNHMIKWKTIQCPRRLHSPNCQWIFKQTGCEYAGGQTWCDHTWERCDALSNTINYGGFPTIADMIHKDINWGRKKSGAFWA